MSVDALFLKFSFGQATVLNTDDVILTRTKQFRFKPNSIFAPACLGSNFFEKLSPLDAAKEWTSLYFFHQVKNSKPKFSIRQHYFVVSSYL